MSDEFKNDKIKKFMDEHQLHKTFEKPVNEWPQIVERIEEPKEKSFWLSPAWLSGALAVAFAAVLFFNFNSTVSSGDSFEREVSLESFLEEAHDLSGEEEDFEDYDGYLALIE